MEETKTEEKLKDCAFLTASGNAEIPTIVSRPYAGAVPAVTCRYLCDRVIGFARSGRFYPTHALDAYDAIWVKIEAKAKRLPKLKKARAETYLGHVINRQLGSYCARRVRPYRIEYNAVARRLDAGDAEATAQRLAEALPARCDARERRLAAALELERIYDLLLMKGHRLAVRAFRAYVAAEGNMLLAARLAHIGKSPFYALWSCWLAAARACLNTNH